MSEIYSNHSGVPSLNLPTNDSLFLNSEEMELQDSGEEGFWIKPLLEDDMEGDNATLRTWLMKVDAGAFSPMHAHDDIEQIFVIEGSFYDQDKIYEPGDYVIRAPGTVHSAGSENGAIVLLFYSPARGSE